MGISGSADGGADVKIYPSNHTVKEVEHPKFLDIPLSHIEKHYIPTSITVEMDPKVASSDMKYLAPYQKFDHDDFLIFDDKGDLSDAKLVMKDGAYIYRPRETQEFSPEEFSCNVLLRREGELRSDRNYDIKVRVFAETDAKDFAKQLMEIFGDAPYRGVAPANIIVNGGSTNAEAMITEDGTDCDFLFVQGTSDEFRKDLKDAIPYSKLFQGHENIWLTLTDEGCNKWFSKLKKGESYKVTRLMDADDGKYAWIPPESPDVQNKYVYAFDSNYGYSAIQGTHFKMFSTGAFKYLLNSTVSAKSPLFIIERENGQYIVVSHENIFSHLNTFGPLVYDVMTKLYARSYVKLRSKQYWIADNDVDYLCSLNTPFHLRHPSINLNDIILDAKKDIEEYSIRSIYTDNSKVSLDHRTDDGALYFKKISASDPAKEVGMTSIYTYQHTILQYKEQKDKTVESGIKINTGIEGGRCYITVLPFSSSKYRLLSKTAKTFELEEVDKTYIVYALPVGFNGESEVGVIREDDKDYDSEASVRLARVHVEFVGEPVAYDLRQLGGGLPETMTDYDMIDIGNPKGRPYRVGVGAVIKLPKAYQKYADKIQKAIESYKVAADKFYVVYE